MSLKGSAGRAILTEEGSVNRLGKKEPLRDSVFNSRLKDASILVDEFSNCYLKQGRIRPFLKGHGLLFCLSSRRQVWVNRR